MKNHMVAGPPGLEVKDIPFKWMWIEGQVERFISRKNGSPEKVILILTQAVDDVQKRDPTFPPVPAEVFVAAIELILKMRNNDVEYETNINRVSELIAKIREIKFYGRVNPRRKS